MWAQRLPDGRYAMVGIYQSTEPDGRRFPLVVSASDDGVRFDSDVLAITTEVPIHRYPDAWPLDHKDSGNAYVRGVVEHNPQPPGDHVWLADSSNKEDIWVARVPTDITGRVIGTQRRHPSDHGNF